MVVKLPGDAREQLSRLPRRPHVVTIGNFDGVHRGHQYLIQLLTERGLALEAEPIAITFEPHPISVLRPGAGFLRLTPPEAKIDLLHRAGAREVVVIPFTHEFSKVDAQDFLRAIDESTNPKAIVVGEGFRFGHRRAGDGSTIAAYAQQRGFEAHVVQRLADGDTVVSSSFVRTELLTGNLHAANKALGRRFRLYGRVERGLSRGRSMGYPTANLDVADELLVPRPGIYAVYVHLPDRRVEQGMLYIGTSPTFDPRGQTVEVHILDFDDDIYGEQIEAELVAYTREDQQFPSISALIKQMESDERQIREILSREMPEQSSGAES